MTLYYMGAFTPVIWSTIAWTEKFNNGLCTHFLRLRRLKISRNSSRLKNRRCELSLRGSFESFCKSIMGEVAFELGQVSPDQKAISSTEG